MNSSKRQHDKTLGRRSRIAAILVTCLLGLGAVAHTRQQEEPPLPPGAKEAAAVQVTVEPNQEKIQQSPEGEAREVVLRINLQGERPPAETVDLPLNVAVVLDRSGSMKGGNRIEYARQGALQVLEMLGADDTFALVSYSTEVTVDVPARTVKDAGDRDLIRRLIERIEPTQSTALYAGVKAGGDEVLKNLDPEKVNRVILLSDGLANRGPSSPREITELGLELARKGVQVSTIGLGEDYNEDLMTALANAGDANYYYVQDIERLPGIFEDELGRLAQVVARDIEIEVTLPEGVKGIEVLGRDEGFEGNRLRIRLGQIAGGQNRDVLVRCEARPGVDQQELELAQVRVRYTDELRQGRRDEQREIARVGISKSAEEARDSVNAPVVVRWLQMENDVAKQKAAVEFDQGRTDAANRLLLDQAERNRAAAGTVPQAAAGTLLKEQSALEREAAIVTEPQTLSEQKGNVKRMKFDSYSRSRGKNVE